MSGPAPESPSPPRGHFHPLGPDAPRVDHVGLAFGALGFSIILGTGFNAAVTWVVRTLQARGPATTAADLGSAPAVVLLGGTFMGLVASGVATWTLLAPIRNPWRQGMLALVSAFAAMAVSLVTIPIYMAFGRPGLAGLVLLAVLCCGYLARRISHLGRQR